MTCEVIAFLTPAVDDGDTRIPQPPECCDESLDLLPLGVGLLGSRRWYATANPFK